MKSLLIFGGNGYVGSHIVSRAVNAGVQVINVCRSGSDPRSERSSLVTTHKGDIFDASTYRHHMDRVSGVISCVGAFGSYEHMKRMCGDATVAAVEESALHPGVQWFGFVSAKSFHLSLHPMAGYYEGKLAAEQSIVKKFGEDRSLILRCPFIYGNRKIGRFSVPLQVVGKPLELLGSSTVARRVVEKVPALDLLFTPAISVDLVAQLLVQSFLNGNPRGIKNPLQMIDLVQK